jgi:hypothetical protein
MSGGGGNDQVLGTALTIGAAIAAPELAPVIFGEGAGIMATAATGAVLGGAANAVTGRDPLQGAVMGGVGGAAAGYGQGLMEGANAGNISTAAFEGTGPGANLTQIGGQPFSQSAYDMSSNLGDASFANPNFTPPPGSTPFNTVTQPMDGLANAGPSTPSGLANTPQVNAPAQLASTNPQNPNAADVSIKPPVVADKGLFNTGITGKQALVGLGGLALWNQIQKENKKYGVPTTQASVPSNLNYTYQTHAPMQLSRSYAEGGAVNFNTSPIKQQINANSIGDNGMFPQPGLHSNQYANPVSTPVPTNIISAPTDSSVDPYTGQQKMAAGGIAQSRLGGYAAGGNPHLLKGPGDGMSDNIPAMIGSKQPARLADGEFVVPADVVSHLGNGSTDAGAQKLHSMMDNVRKARTGKKAQGKQIKADKYMPKFADGGPVINAQLPTQQVTPAASPALVLPSQVAAAQAAQPTTQGLGATAPAPAPVQPSMTDQMAAYRNNMLYQYAPTNENFLKQQYLNNLGRAPDQPGMDYWTQQLKNGASPQDVANQFKTSPEAAHVSGIRQVMDNANNPSTNMSPNAISSLVNSAYQGNLGRAPDAAGAQYWSEQLASGKLTPQQFVDQLKASAEFTNKSTGGGGGGILSRLAGTQAYDSSLTG